MTKAGAVSNGLKGADLWDLPVAVWNTRAVHAAVGNTNMTVHNEHAFSVLEHPVSQI